MEEMQSSISTCTHVSPANGELMSGSTRNSTACPPYYVYVLKEDKEIIALLDKHVDMVSSGHHNITSSFQRRFEDFVKVIQESRIRRSNPGGDNTKRSCCLLRHP